MKKARTNKSLAFLKVQKRGHLKRDAAMSMRISSNTRLRLKKEASKQEITLNALIASVLDEYVDWLTEKPVR